MSFKAIETVYKGYRFRSRLEARWALFFDEMGYEWEYELEGYQLSNGEWYLPDFILRTNPGSQQSPVIYVEIKGQEPSKEEINKALILQMDSGTTVHIYFGDPYCYKIVGGVPKIRIDESGNLIVKSSEIEPAITIGCDFDKNPSLKLCWPWVYRAALKARQARFEHGETS